MRTQPGVCLLPGAPGRVTGRDRAHQREGAQRWLAGSRSSVLGLGVRGVGGGWREGVGLPDTVTF